MTTPDLSAPSDGAGSIAGSRRSSAPSSAAGASSSLPLGLEYRAHRGADGRWDVHLWWAGDRWRRWWLYALQDWPEDTIEQVLAFRLHAPLDPPRYDRDVRAEIRRENRSRAKFLAADPLRGTTITYDAPIATITRADRWTPSAVTATNVALAQLGAGLSLIMGERTPDVFCRVAGSSVASVCTVQSFIVPAVTPRAQGRPA